MAGVILLYIRYIRFALLCRYPDKLLYPFDEGTIALRILKACRTHWRKLTVIRFIHLSNPIYLHLLSIGLCVLGL